jgi:hypothetical protein
MTQAPSLKEAAEQRREAKAAQTTTAPQTLRDVFVDAAAQQLQKTYNQKTHPEAPADGKDETPSMVSEGSFITEGQIYDAQIRSQQLQQKKHTLRGNIAKTERKKLWADTEELKRDIQADDKEATAQKKVLNRDGHVQTLAGKSYKVESDRSRNNGMRQKLLNEGIKLNLDHTQGFDAAVKRG